MLKTVLIHCKLVASVSTDKNYIKSFFSPKILNIFSVYKWEDKCFEWSPDYVVFWVQFNWLDVVFQQVESFQM